MKRLTALLLCLLVTSIFSLTASAAGAGALKIDGRETNGEWHDYRTLFLSPDSGMGNGVDAAFIKFAYVSDNNLKIYMAAQLRPVPESFEEAGFSVSFDGGETVPVLISGGTDKKYEIINDSELRIEGASSYDRDGMIYCELDVTVKSGIGKALESSFRVIDGSGIPSSETKYSLLNPNYTTTAPAEQTAETKTETEKSATEKTTKEKTTKATTEKTTKEKTTKATTEKTTKEKTTKETTEKTQNSQTVFAVTEHSRRTVSSKAEKTSKAAKTTAAKTSAQKKSTTRKEPEKVYVFEREVVVSDSPETSYETESATETVTQTQTAFTAAAAQTISQAQTSHDDGSLFGEQGISKASKYKLIAGILAFILFTAVGVAAVRTKAQADNEEEKEKQAAKKDSSAEKEDKSETGGKE